MAFSGNGRHLASFSQAPPEVPGSEEPFEAAIYLLGPDVLHIVIYLAYTHTFCGYNSQIIYEISSDNQLQCKLYYLWTHLSKEDLSFRFPALCFPLAPLLPPQHQKWWGGVVYMMTQSQQLCF